MRGLPLIRLQFSFHTKTMTVFIWDFAVLFSKSFPLSSFKAESLFLLFNQIIFQDHSPLSLMLNGSAVFSPVESPPILSNMFIKNFEIPLKIRRLEISTKKYRWDEDAPSWLTATEFIDTEEVAAIKVTLTRLQKLWLKLNVEVGKFGIAETILWKQFHIAETMMEKVWYCRYYDEQKRILNSMLKVKSEIEIQLRRWRGWRSFSGYQQKQLFTGLWK